jgi:RNA polymerase sigma factor (sigma-70 family)
MSEYVINTTENDIDTCISKTSQGDMTSLKMLYEQLRLPVYLVALSILKDHALAEDALQETFIAVKSSAKAYKTGTNAKAWVLSITRNICKDCLRNRRHETQPFDDSIEQTAAEMSRGAEQDLLGSVVVSEKLAALEKDERSIIVLHVFAGLKLNEIAKLLSIPYGTILWRHSKAINKLKKLYNEEQ